VNPRDNEEVMVDHLAELEGELEEVALLLG
jgi:hypothetical protein